MQTFSLKKNRPHLESVLGPLSEQEDAKIRAVLDEVDDVLLEIARHFHLDGAGWEKTGLELTSMASGQVEICSHIGASIDPENCVDFCVELRPSWYFGQRSSSLTWVVTTEICADCHHAVSHSSMDSVHETSASAVSPVEAVATLLAATQDLLHRATDFPLAHWLELASDASEQGHGADSP